MDVSTGMASLSSAISLFKGFVALRDEAKVAELRLAGLREMTRAEELIHTLQLRIRELEKENSRLLDQQQLALQAHGELQRYEPVQVASGVLVYALKVGDPPTPQLPYFCYACYENGNKSVLTFETATGPANPSALQCTAQRGHRFQLPRGFRVHHLPAHKAT